MEVPGDYGNSKSGNRISFGKTSPKTRPYVHVSPKWERTRCLEELASIVGMTHPLYIFGRILEFDERQKSTRRSSLVTMS